MYHVSCSCGQKIKVDLFQAGTTAKCPVCDRAVSIPGSTKLKELAGDPYPHLNHFDKLVAALERHESPFDGTCHGCQQADADCQIPIRFDVMVERHLEDDDGGIRPSLTGLAVVVSAAEEQWKSITIPLSLCSDCRRKFEAELANEKTTRVVTDCCWFTFSFAALIFLFRQPLFLVLLDKLRWLISLVLAVVIVCYRHRRKQGNKTILSWLQGVRWVPEAIRDEDEYKLTVAKVDDSETLARR